MPSQPNLFPPEPAEVSPAPPARDGRLAAPAKRSPWLARVELLVRVMVRLYLGLLIMALPWMRFWSENGLLSFTRLSAQLTGSGFVRGAVSGLGLLNVIIALQELFLPTDL